MKDEGSSYSRRRLERLLVYPFFELQYEEESLEDIIKNAEGEPMRELVEISKTGQLLSIKETEENLENSAVLFDE